MVYSAGLHLIIVIISNKLWMIQQPSAGRKQQVINIDLLRRLVEGDRSRKGTPRCLLQSSHGNDGGAVLFFPGIEALSVE